MRILEWVAISSLGDLFDPGIKARSPALQADSLPSEPPGKHTKVYRDIFFPGAHSLQLDLKDGWDPRPHWSHCKRKMATDGLEQTQEKSGLGLSFSSAAYQLIIPEQVTQLL